MSLTLYSHPLWSFCQKVLIALCENETPFEPRFVDLDDEASRAEFFALWPMGKMPVLRDEARGLTIPETSIIIEYLERHYPGRLALIPADSERAREVRLADRFYDHYVEQPMGKIVTDRLRPPGRSDTSGIKEARQTLRTAYTMIEQDMATRTWAAGETFSLADCGAGPALHYAELVEPFGRQQANLAAYLARLKARPAYARVLAEAEAFAHMFPAEPAASA